MGQNNENETYIRRCLEIAEIAKTKGNHPFGTLLVYEGKILLEVENTVITDRDATQHSELKLVQQACKKFPKEILRNSTLYTSTEPCAMCSGAIYWAGIPNVVYGAPAKVLKELGSGSLVISSREIFEKGKRKVTVTGPVLPEESRKVHVDFWKKS